MQLLAARSARQPGRRSSGLSFDGGARPARRPGSGRLGHAGAVVEDGNKDRRRAAARARRPGRGTGGREDGRGGEAVPVFSCVAPLASAAHRRDGEGEEEGDGT